MPTSGIITSATDVTVNITSVSPDYTVQWTDDGSVASGYRWLVLLSPTSLAQSIRASSNTPVASVISRRVVSGANSRNTTSTQSVTNSGSDFLAWPPDTTVDNWTVLDPLGVNTGWSRSALFAYGFGAHFISGPVAGTKLDGFAPEGWHFRWQAWQVPTITSLSVSSGLAVGGTSVQINGTEFYQSTSTITPHVRQVFFGGVAANITASNPTFITVDTPAHAAGVVDVSVVITYDDGSTETVILPASYTYFAPTTVSITGSGGAVVSRGSGGVIAAGAGVPPELHVNQWGLLHFVMRARVEERI